MKIAILSREPKNYSTRRLVEVAQARGHQVEVLDTLRCYMNIASHNPSIHYEGGELGSYDAVIPRIGASITAYGTAVLRQFEMMNTMALNSSVAISRSRDKLRAMQLLSRHGIGLPITGYAHSTHDVPDLITMVGGAPLVVKLLEGTQGIGVVLCETQKAAESVIEAFIQTNNNILVQEYIREANGADIRCLVVNGKVVAAMRRQAQPGSFAPTCTVAAPPRRSRSPRKSAPPPCRPPRSWGWMWRGWISCVAPVARWCWRSTPPRACKGGSRLRQGCGRQNHRVPRTQGEPQEQTGGVSLRLASVR